nr:hypothetical protein [Tanacetum cinerariifolium]
MKNAFPKRPRYGVFFGILARKRQYHRRVGVFVPRAEISEDQKNRNDEARDTFWYKILDVYNEQAEENGWKVRNKNMLTGKWTPMNRDVQKFNSIYDQSKLLSGENEDDLFAQYEDKGDQSWMLLGMNVEATLMKRIFTRLFILRSRQESIFLRTYFTSNGRSRQSRSKLEQNSPVKAMSNDYWYFTWGRAWYCGIFSWKVGIKVVYESLTLKLKIDVMSFIKVLIDAFKSIGAKEAEVFHFLK